MKPLTLLIFPLLLTTLLAGCDSTRPEEVAPQTNQASARLSFSRDFIVDLEITDPSNQVVATAFTGSLTRDDQGAITQIEVRDSNLRNSGPPIQQDKPYFLGSKGGPSAKYRYKGMTNKNHVFARMVSNAIQ